VIPLVDLVITHGGNNSTCETFHFGKPMIVMPIFWDQLDNAERVREFGFGIRLNPYHCSRQELLEAVEKTINDGDLANKMSRIGERIRSSNSNEKAADLIMKFV
jgi:UDP:flavonoid glycosyltransferase YjiC (YdhE family)